MGFAMTDRITLTPIWALMLLGHELSTSEAKSYGLHAIIAVVNDDECDTFQDVSYALGIRSVSAHTRRGHFTQMPMPRMEAELTKQENVFGTTTDPFSTVGKRRRIFPHAGTSRIVITNGASFADLLDVQ